MIFFKKANTPEYEVEKICANCFYAERINESDACICEKSGVVKSGGSCGKFKLDLLKIDPSPNNEL